jgi:hypothetical protein
MFLVVAGWVGAQPPAVPAAIRVAFVSPEASQPESKDPRVIFFDDFNQAGDLRSRYFEYGDSRGSFVPAANEGLDGSGGMRCTFEKGQVTAGNLKVVFGRSPFNRGPRREETFREVYWRVYLRHEPGWEGNPAKLARATCMAGPDWSQGLIAHVWGGRGDVLCIDPATGIRDSRKVTTRYNDFANLRWLGVKHGQTPVFHPSESGRWVCVESQVKLNAPGRRDGVFRLWVDGRLEAEHTTLDWHGSWNDYAVNAVFLENYWNKGSLKRQSRWFDDFVISTRPIGPVAAAVVPQLTRTSAPGIAAWEAQAATNPDGKNIVWTSRTQGGQAARLPIDGAHGAFAGARSLPPGTTCWLRLRSRGSDGAWSGWTAWHAPFRAAGV